MLTPPIPPSETPGRFLRSDTDPRLAAFIARGTCHEVVEQRVYHHEIVGSSFLLDEFRLLLERYRGIDILSPGTFWRYQGGSKALDGG